MGSQGTPPVSAAALPQAPGVYRFRDRAGRVLYIGRAVSLRRRVLSYWGDLGDRAHLAPMVARIARIEAVTCDSAHEAAWLERNLLEHRRPPWNRTPGGQEAEVWIRLSASPRRPGLTVVRQSAPGDFGPYLGGQKVRDAVSGLGRVLPLGYAGDAQPLGVELLGRVTVQHPDRHDRESGDHEPSRSWVMSQLLPSGSSTPNQRPHGASSTWLFGCTPRPVSSA